MKIGIVSPDFPIGIVSPDFPKILSYGFALLLASFLLSSIANAPQASQRLLIPFEPLKGLNRIAMFVNLGPGAEVILSPTDKNHSVPVLTSIEQAAGSALNDILAASNDVQVAEADTSKESILYVDVLVSARQETSVSGQDTKIGSITAKISNSNGIIQFPIISYPFLVTGSEDELKASVSKGVHYLLSYLPTYIVCANQKDNSTPCDLKHTFGEPK